MSATLGLGSCCVCGKEDATVRNLVLLPWKGGHPGHGWGCLVCGLPGNGATAVICDGCAKAHENEVGGGSWLKWICSGYPKDDRIPFSTLDTSNANAHMHDLEAHKRDEATVRFAS
jgi:hypothetical protein